MPDKGNGLSQTTLILRLLCGGYLIYLGISLLAEGAGALFAAAAVVFILVGGGLLFFTLRTGLRSWKQGGQEDDSEGPDEDKE